MSDPLVAAVDIAIAEPFWANAIAQGVVTEKEARDLIPVVLVTPEGVETPAYIASLIGPMQKMIDYEVNLNV